VASAPDPRRSDEAGFARTTISVPAPLKARMERVTVNWSAVASEAFEQYLRRMPLREVTMSEDEAIERLRRLKDQGPPGADPATAIGRRWAMADAHPQELERLREYFETRLEPRRLEPRWTRREDSGPQGAMELGREIAAVVTNVSHPSGQDEWKRFWKERSGMDLSRRPSAGEVYNFCRGAVQFWREVKDKI